MSERAYDTGLKTEWVDEPQPLLTKSEISRTTGVKQEMDRQPEISLYLDSIDKNLERLGATVSQLESRLAPICRPIPEAGSNPPMGQGETYTALGERLDNFVNRIAHAQGDLNVLIESLEL